MLNILAKTYILATRMDDRSWFEGAKKNEAVKGSGRSVKGRSIKENDGSKEGAGRGSVLNKMSLFRQVLSQEGAQCNL